MYGGKYGTEDFVQGDGGQGVGFVYQMLYYIFRLDMNQPAAELQALDEATKYHWSHCHALSEKYHIEVLSGINHSLVLQTPIILLAFQPKKHAPILV